MGTRSLTVFKEAAETEIVVMYRQMDGYPSGHGKDLQDLLKGFKIVNGYNEKKRIANGMPCLSAQVIAGLKDGCGSIYLYPAGTRDAGEAYLYTLYPEKTDGTGRVMVKVEEVYGVGILYQGALDDWDIKE